MTRSAQISGIALALATFIVPAVPPLQGQEPVTTESVATAPAPAPEQVPVPEPRTDGQEVAVFTSAQALAR